VSERERERKKTHKREIGRERERREIKRLKGGARKQERKKHGEKKI